VTADGLPNFVSIPSDKQLGGRVRYTGALYLGAKCEPFVSGSVPDRASGGYTLPTGLTLSAGVSPARLADRSRLLASIDVAKRQCDEIAAVQELSAYQHQAIDLLLGQRGQAAFDINQEPPETREMYGDSQMGQGTLLARRLVEAGVTYILVNYSKNNSWDTHNDNFKRMKKSLLPPMDQAVTALLTDLKQRDLLDDVLVLLMGEMGRTPKINKQSGRDHWPDVFSLMIAGGGLTRGQVLGSSSSLAEVPHDRPVHYHEILATVYHQLGIDPHLMLRDRQQRPIRILHDAEPVYELIA
jgi:uncharacterized protein (DUF1501 family)